MVYVMPRSLVYVILLLKLHCIVALICSRYPANTFTPKSPVDENFVISVSGNPQTYVLGQPYNVSLNAFNGLRFVSFSLALENDNGDPSYTQDLGQFEVSDPVETRYSLKCNNMVESTNTNPKTRIDVNWVAPMQPGSGCILIRATVLQHRDVWYMDDGGLTKRICEEVVDDVESLSTTAIRPPCCSCDEARYELIFEGLWSRNLHPKDFPTKGWITRFSDIIGAAHTADYRFWEYGALATEGMKEFAEHGSTRTLEREFNENFKNGKIRTIIKARGPMFPNLYGPSIASVRVDPEHHLISLASKIDPSPDWIVGVSGLELCMINCTWLESKVINLYAWDIGTDAGASYTSANQPQIPPDVIRRMRSDYPSDPRSPFYDETGAPMKPLATLTIRRHRLYERLCEDEESNNVGVPRECATHPWTAWTICSAKCGQGRQFRMRVYKQPDVARLYNCDSVMTNRQDRECTGNECVEPERNWGLDVFRPMGDPNLMRGGTEEADFERESRAECQLTSWSGWSPCNATCGEGVMTQVRQYTNPMAERRCQSVKFMPLYNYKKCFGRDCMGEIATNNENYEGSEGEEPYGTFGANEFDPNKQPVGGGGFNNEYEANGDWNNGGNGDTIENDGVTQDWNTRDNNVYGSVYENERYGSVGPDYNANGGFQVENLNKKIEGDGRVGSNTNYRSSFNPQFRPNGNLYEERRTKQPSERNDFGGSDEESDKMRVPPYCFERLHMFTCLNTTVINNFWFYNFCEDQCMLFAADGCDRNENKFNSLEMCEMRCRIGISEDYLKKKQMQNCYKHQSVRKSRRRYQGPRQLHSNGVL